MDGVSDSSISSTVYPLKPPASESLGRTQDRLEGITSSVTGGLLPLTRCIHLLCYSLWRTFPVWFPNWLCFPSSLL